MDNPLLNNYILFWVVVLGLCLGSFFNVVILRSLSGESIVFPPSKCPKCGNKLKPWHNIPVLSYIFLRGKCAYCKEKISIQYPIVELVTMILYLFSYLKFGLTLKALFSVIALSCLLIMSMTDLKEKLVDCNIAIGLGVFGLVYNHNWDSVLALLAAVLIMEGLARLGYLFTNDRAFGEADTYVAGALGACFGLSGLWMILLYTFIASVVFIVPVFFYNQYRNGHKWVCVLAVLFILSTLAFKLALETYWMLTIVVLSGSILAFAILKGLRKDPCPLYLPLVPAFFAATLYFLFF